MLRRFVVATRVHDMKRCPRCGVDKPRADYYTATARADGLAGYCKVCSRELDYARRLAHYRADPWRHLWQQKRRTARGTGTLFTISIEWTRDAGAKGCPYLRIPFTMIEPQPPGSPVGGATHPLSPHFDQMKPGAGYTPENTRIITAWANIAKWNLSHDDFVAYCQMVGESQGGEW